MSKHFVFYCPILARNDIRGILNLKISTVSEVVRLIDLLTRVSAGREIRFLTAHCKQKRCSSEANNRHYISAAPTKALRQLYRFNRVSRTRLKRCDWRKAHVAAADNARWSARANSALDFIPVGSLPCPRRKSLGATQHHKSNVDSPC